MPAIDPITTQVIRNALKAAADEMQISLVKTAHNPLIYEVHDFGVVLTDHLGQILAEGSGLPGFLGCLPSAIVSGLKVVGAENFSDGDVILTNEPDDTGTHLSDVVVYMPILYKGRLVAFSSVMAHWADVGGVTPGGWCPDSTDVHQEGMIFSHLKLYEGGKLNTTLERMILKNVRFPELVHGDMNAMIAACHTGARRYQALCDRFGADVLQASMEAVFNQSEQMMRRKVAEIPDGIYSAETWLDHDGIELDKPRKIKVTITVKGEEMIMDWTGSSEVASGPINHPFVETRALGYCLLKSLTAPFDPMNQGHLRPLTVTAPPNTVVSPVYPAPCDSYGYVGEMIIQLIARALSQAIPERCPACSYQMFGPYFFRTDPRHGEPFIFIDPVDGGGGAFPHADGPSALIFVGDGDCPNTPAEIIETRYPLLVRRYALNLEGAGKGKYRGGFGVIRDYEMLEDNILMQLMNENTLYPPWGLFGGDQSGVSKAIVWEGTDHEQVLTRRISYFGPLHKGDRVSARTTGGGGWGDPKERDPELVKNDVLNGFLSAAEAEKIYGVKV
ncbi:MAG: hydantoinase B/oxoprolinase family protein [Chloroflexi bacterium]|nr:hydantoinase B/oxoprolinase family protein [Chloroflexota bacterium]